MCTVICCNPNYCVASSFVYNTKERLAIRIVRGANAVQKSHGAQEELTATAVTPSGVECGEDTV